MSGQTIHSASNIGGVLDNIIDLFKKAIVMLKRLL